MARRGGEGQECGGNCVTRGRRHSGDVRAFYVANGQGALQVDQLGFLARIRIALQ